MANRYRLYPTEEQAVFMRERHCADARYVWNLAVEQFGYRQHRERGTSGRPAPGPTARQRQLAEARQEIEWLRCGSSSVQQQALRAFDRAVQACFDGNAKEPRWRKRGVSEGFCVRDTKVVVHSRAWAQIAVPKLGWVKFKLSRALPAGKLKDGSDHRGPQWSLACKFPRAAAGGARCRQGGACYRYRPWRGHHYRHLGRSDVSGADDAQTRAGKAGATAT